MAPPTLEPAKKITPKTKPSPKTLFQLTKKKSVPAFSAELKGILCSTIKKVVKMLTQEIVKARGRKITEAMLHKAVLLEASKLLQRGAPKRPATTKINIKEVSKLTLITGHKGFLLALICAGTFMFGFSNYCFVKSHNLTRHQLFNSMPPTEIINNETLMPAKTAGWV